MGIPDLGSGIICVGILLRLNICFSALIFPFSGKGKISALSSVPSARLEYVQSNHQSPQSTGKITVKLHSC